MRTRITLIAHWAVFWELAHSIKHALIHKFNFEPSTIKVRNTNDRDSNDMLKFLGEDYDLTFYFVALRKHIPRCRGRKILFQTEELWNRRARNHYFGLYASMYDRVLEMYDENVNLRGTENVVYCPVGYSPVYESNLPEVEKDIDILFHGSLTPRREKFFNEFQKRGYKCFTTRDKFGIERDKLIMRSKIDINIKAHDKWSYGPLHCLPAQANKQFMLAEKADGGYGPFKPDIHIAEYNGLEDCLEKVDYWLHHDNERKDFAINAYEDMVKTCNFDDIFEKAMGPCPEKRLGSFL